MAQTGIIVQSGTVGKSGRLVSRLDLLTALPSGWLADRSGRKLLIAISG